VIQFSVTVVDWPSNAAQCFIQSHTFSSFYEHPHSDCGVWKVSISNSLFLRALRVPFIFIGFHVPLSQSFRNLTRQCSANFISHNNDVMKWFITGLVRQLPWSAYIFYIHCFICNRKKTTVHCFVDLSPVTLTFKCVFGALWHCRNNMSAIEFHQCHHQHG
jgi:hypothetical protein